MARTFSTADLGQLPKLDSSAAQALGTAVATTAKAHPGLPDAVTEALDNVEHSLKNLKKAAAWRLPPASANPRRARAADLAIDAAWSGIFDWLTGWSKLPIHPESAKAAALLAKVFPEGLKFILLAYKLEWAESNTRLLLIKEEKLDADFDALGGEKILRALRQAHQAYGDALGITDLAAPEAGETAWIRAALDDFITDLRAYRARPAPSAVSSEPLVPALESCVTVGYPRASRKPRRTAWRCSRSAGNANEAICFG